jgi:polysaccharide biosynthesis/export protein
MAVYGRPSPKRGTEPGRAACNSEGEALALEMVSLLRMKRMPGPLAVVALIGVTVYAGSQEAKPAAPTAPAGKPPATRSVVPATPISPEYIIGADDVLSIVYWKDKDMSSEVSVRPDGKISLSLLNDVQAAGLTPTQLRDGLIEQSRRFLADPDITVIVHAINSRKVFITGEVAHPGPYPLTGPTSVLQLIAVAGGLRDYADGKRIVILRTENGGPVTYLFNYKEVSSRKNLTQNIELKPGDTVIVP